jgi:HTH-type transcriptional regulator, sugar sensing transcriptional regulator
MDLGTLAEIGLSRGEIAVYRALLELGATKTGALAERAGVSSSKVYKILGRLQKKGLAGFVVRQGVKHYRAQPPGRILDYIDEKSVALEESRKKVEGIIPGLMMAQRPEPTNAAVYEGFKAVTNIFRGIVGELKRGESYYVIGATYGGVGPELKRFFYKHHQRRIDAGIKVMMLANYDVKGSLVKTTERNSEIRYLPSYFVDNCEIVVYKNKCGIVLFTKEPTAVLIENAEIAKNFMNYFRALWKIAKKQSHDP